MYSKELVSNIVDFLGHDKPVLLVASPDLASFIEEVKAKCYHVVVLAPEYADVKLLSKSNKFRKAVYLIGKHEDYHAGIVSFMKDTLSNPEADFNLVRVPKLRPEGWNPKAQTCDTYLLDTTGELHAVAKEDMVLVPRSLLNDAAVALENKAWADETLSSLRSFASSDEQKSIIHIVAGDEDWDPTLEDLESLCDLFLGALEDEKGAVLVTRKGVKVRIETAEEADIHNSSVRLVRATADSSIKYHVLNPEIPVVSFDDVTVAQELSSNCAAVIQELAGADTEVLHRKAFELEKNFGAIRAAMILLCKRKIMCKERIHHLAELQLNEWN